MLKNCCVQVPFSKTYLSQKLSKADYACVSETDFYKDNNNVMIYLSSK